VRRCHLIFFSTVEPPVTFTPVEKQPPAPNADEHAHSDLQTRLGAVVRSVRRQLGITQEELAWRADMHRTYIADIERGARNLTLRSAENLAKALHVTVGNLFTYATAPSEAGASNWVDVGAGQAREILLIEDSRNDVELTQHAFKHARVTNPLRVVPDAESAWDYLLGAGRYAKYRPARPQLILLDLNLPRMSGVEFLRRIKGDVRTREIPVVILTVSSTDRMIVECGRLGAANYIIKPFGVEGLIGVAPKLHLDLTLGPSAASDRPSAG
jgi:CheY-like chemotaxis protein/DNA-binding XRE family transcriptional regulator